MYWRPVPCLTFIEGKVRQSAYVQQATGKLGELKWNNFHAGKGCGSECLRVCVYPCISTVGLHACKYSYICVANKIPTLPRCIGFDKIKGGD